MMFMNVENLDRFFEIVNYCEQPVKLLVADQEPADLRGNHFIQDLLIDTQNGITKLAVETESEKDAIKLIRFMMEDGTSRSEVKGSARISAA